MTPPLKDEGLETPQESVNESERLRNAAILIMRRWAHLWHIQPEEVYTPEEIARADTRLR